VSANEPRTDRIAAAAGPDDACSWEPEIIAFCCNYCAYAAADLAGSKRMQYPTNVRVIHAPCTGKIEIEHILEAFLKGIDGILVAGCLEGGCHFLEGNLRARRRTDHIRGMLAEIGISAERLKMVNLSAAMAPTFVESVREMVDTVRELGPSPLNSFSRQKERTGTE
jgi:F420-non-reducing hydrogenase iron-sulfur subunit